MIITALGLGGYYGIHKALLTLPLRTIVVDGAENFHCALPKQGMPVIEVSLQDLYQSAQTSPWVQSVHVRRLLPYTISMKIVEYIPFAIWDDKKLTTKEGYVITEQIGDRQLLSIDGQGANTAAYHFIEELDLLSYDKIKKLEYIGQRRWDVMLSNGLTVKLPDQDYKLAWTKAIELIEKDHLVDSNIKYLDMRLPDKIFTK